MAVTVMLGYASSSQAMMGSGNYAAMMGSYMMMPSGQMMFSFNPVVDPVIGTDASTTMPIGLGPVAVGGNMLSIHAAIGTFSAPVDMYFAIYAPAIDPMNVYLLHNDGSIEPTHMGMVPWKSGITAVDETLFVDIPASMLPKGSYMFGLMTVPSGSDMSRYYLWTTQVQIQ